MLETILERMETRLDGMSKKLERLEVQNEILRKELHGIRSSSTHKDSFALMEAKTLRELVEEIQFHVTNINAKLADCVERHEADEGNNNIKKQPYPRSTKSVGTEEEEESSDDNSGDELNVVEIRSKTMAEEQDWLKGKFTELRNKTAVQGGASLKCLKGKNIELISKSIPLSESYQTSCVLKLTNGLKSALSDPKFHYFGGTKMTGPSVVAGNFNEIFLGSGNWCNFLCSFSISNSLRMVIGCVNKSSSQMVFYIGFIPDNVPTDQALVNKLNELESIPDFRVNKAWGTEPIELFVTTGQFLAKGHMRTVGSRAIVHVDIMELDGQTANESLSSKSKIMPSNLKGTVEKISRGLAKNHNLCRDSQDEDIKISCSVEIFNLLNVTLRNRQSFYCGGGRQNYIPSEVRPLQGVAAFASNDKFVEGMFSYEIESTDLCLVLAFQAKGNENSFAAAFLPFPTLMNKREMKKFTGGNHWKFHDWRKSAQAKEGEQMVKIRNIQAVISMTEGVDSLLKIQVFAV